MTKMIGVCSLRGRWRIKDAVSKPSMPGMETSMRMTAQSSLSRQRSASLPLWAKIKFWPKRRSTASNANSLSSRSSTSRIFTLLEYGSRRPPFCCGANSPLPGGTNGGLSICRVSISMGMALQASWVSRTPHPGPLPVEGRGGARVCQFVASVFPWQPEMSWFRLESRAENR